MIVEGVEVVRAAVLEEARDRGIEVAVVERAEHVVDEVVDVEQPLVGRIAGAVRVESLHAVVDHVGAEALPGRVPEPVVCVQSPVRGFDGVGPARDRHRP